MLFNLLKTHLNSECTVIYQEVSTLCGSNIQAAGLLSKLLYWSDVVQNDAERNGWVYKTAADLKRELGLTRRGYQKARKYLLELGVLQYRRGGVHGKMHWRLNAEQLLEQVYLKVKNVSLPKGFLKTQIDIDNTQIPAWVPLNKWNEYLFMLKSSKNRRLSNKQKKKLIAKLDKIRQLKYDLNNVIERSIIGCWNDFFIPDNTVYQEKKNHQQKMQREMRDFLEEKSKTKPPPDTPNPEIKNMISSVLKTLSVQK